MKNIKRILIECFIIACVFGIVNFASGQAVMPKNKSSELAPWIIGVPAGGLKLSKDDARKLDAIWSEAYKKKYGAIGGVKILLGYNKDTMELNTASVPTRGIGIYDPKSFDFLAQVYSAGSIVKSNNDLAKRVRDLENRVQDIEKNCCP